MQHSTQDNSQCVDLTLGSRRNSDMARASNFASPPSQPFGDQTGFACDFSTEVHEGALPIGRNSPQKIAYGVYAEQFTGTAFTAPRARNRRSWLHRVRPSAVHRPFTRLGDTRLVSDFACVPPTPPNQFRWDAPALPQEPTDFVKGLVTMAGNGSADSMNGCAIHLYAANRSMSNRFFYSADGELLVVPQLLSRPNSLLIHRSCKQITLSAGRA